MKFVAHLLLQGEQLILNTTLNLKDISDNSEVLIYEKYPYGYQRPIDSNHSNKIKEKAFKIKDGAAIFPTSIILGINEDDIKDKYKQVSLGENICSNLVHVVLENSSNLFRIIDGQHRIVGLSMAAEIDEELWRFPLNVTILIIPSDKRYIELDVFEDINSTAKKLKTDLILLARQQYVILGAKDLEEKSEEEDYVAIKTSYLLNEKIENSVWNNAIKFEKNINNKIGIIGVSPFSKAIKPLVKKRLSGVQGNNISELNDIAESLATYINEAWLIVSEKWGKCFELDYVNVEDEIYEILYNPNYYLQKTTGVNAITRLLDEKENINDFKKLILESKLVADDWEKGGKMAGLTSGSGFKKAIELITM